ncbi:unnamed protein product [Soboliphyme baturini]|uniref:PH domain-containing protein n=1 Tax=Soboliphyme baturini TaxID=241478 RepID=A0A183I908_9BILA|nr:unnamed protein product [Soboliphyme baturini]
MTTTVPDLAMDDYETASMDLDSDTDQPNLNVTSIDHESSDSQLTSVPSTLPQVRSDSDVRQVSVEEVSVSRPGSVLRRSGSCKGFDSSSQATAARHTNNDDEEAETLREILLRSLATKKVGVVQEPILIPLEDSDDSESEVESMNDARSVPSNEEMTTKKNDAAAALLDNCLKSAREKALEIKRSKLDEQNSETRDASHLKSTVIQSVAEENVEQPASVVSTTSSIEARLRACANDMNRHRELMLKNKKRLNILTTDGVRHKVKLRRLERAAQKLREQLNRIEHCCVSERQLKIAQGTVDMDDCLQRLYESQWNEILLLLGRKKKSEDLQREPGVFQKSVIREKTNLFTDFHWLLRNVNPSLIHLGKQYCSGRIFAVFSHVFVSKFLLGSNNYILGYMKLWQSLLPRFHFMKSLKAKYIMLSLNSLGEMVISSVSFGSGSDRGELEKLDHVRVTPVDGEIINTSNARSEDANTVSVAVLAKTKDPQLLKAEKQQLILKSMLSNRERYKQMLESLTEPAVGTYLCSCVALHITMLILVNI